MITWALSRLTTLSVQMHALHSRRPGRGRQHQVGQNRHRIGLHRQEVEQIGDWIIRRPAGITIQKKVELRPSFKVKQKYFGRHLKIILKI